MGVVYEAHDRARGHKIALKTLKQRDPEALYRLKREFRALADMSHPNLVELYDLVIQDTGAAYVTMELIDGRPFVDYCRESVAQNESPSGISRDDTEPAWDGPAGGSADGAMLETRVRDATRQLAVGIRRLHHAGLVHRDLKPSNVLVTDAGRVVVLDFGLIAELHGFADDTLAGKIVGTVEYMAPEQATGGDVTPAADWFSVGALVYQALTGRVPHGGSLMEVLRAKAKPPPPPRVFVPAIAKDLDALCCALLHPDPNERPSGDAILRILGATTTVVLSTPAVRLTGRKDELSRLREALDMVRRGNPTAALVRGATGVGKSALVRHLLVRAAETTDDLVVLAGRCYQREVVPYKAMDGVIDHLASHWAALDPARAEELVPDKPWLLRRLFPGLARVPAVDRDAPSVRIGDVQELASQAFQQLRSVIVALARQSPLVVFIDDMQWIDADSLALLSALARPPDAPAMLLAMCSRREENHQLKTLLRRLEIPITTIELGPLDVDAARALAAQLLGPDSDRLVAQIAEESGGEPFVIEELARYASALGTEDVASVSVERALEMRLQQLPDESLRLMEALSVAGEPVSVRVSAAVANLSVPDAGSALRRLRSERLARSAGERVEPYHDRVRQHIATHLEGAHRRDVHRKLALAYELCDEGTSELLARHWHLAGELDRASHRARSAAQEAAHTGDFDRAARSYQLALEIGSFGEEELRATQTALAEALAAAGQPFEAAAAFATAARGASDVTALRLSNRSAGELLRGGYLDEGLAAIREVLAAVGLRLPRSARRALLSALWRRFWLRIRGLRWTERAPEAIPELALARLDIVTSCAVSLGNVDYFSGFEFQSRQLAQALRVGDRSRVARAFAVEAGYLATLGSTSRAERLASIALDLHRQGAGGAIQVPYALWARGAIKYFATCEFEAAYECFAETEQELRADNLARGWEMDMTQQYMCFSQRYRGRFAWLARTVPRLVREAERRGDIYATVNLRLGLNTVYLLRDRPDLAEHALSEAITDWPNEERGFQVQHLWRLFSACAIDLYTGNPDRGLERLRASRKALRRSLLLHVPILTTERTYLEAALALASSRPDGAATARKAAARLGRCKAAIAGPMATGVRAALAWREGDREGARALYELAATQFEARGADGHRVAAQRHLGLVCGGEVGAQQVALADTWFMAERVKAPARIAALLVPGPASAPG